MRFNVTQGHQFQYQLKAHMQLFLCVNNINFLPILHCFRYTRIIGPISAVNSGSLSLMHLFGVNLTKLSYGVHVCV